jgi:hypothetical protein
MSSLPTIPLFTPGKIVATPGALALLTQTKLEAQFVFSSVFLAKISPIASKMPGQELQSGRGFL